MESFANPSHIVALNWDIHLNLVVTQIECDNHILAFKVHNIIGW
jgi:hypothetical protein